MSRSYNGGGGGNGGNGLPVVIGDGGSIGDSCGGAGDESGLMMMNGSEYTQEQHEQLLAEQMFPAQNPDDLQQPQQPQEYVQGSISEFISGELHSFLVYIHHLNIHPRVYQAIISEVYHVKLFKISFILIIIYS